MCSSWSQTTFGYAWPQNLTFLEKNVIEFYFFFPHDIALIAEEIISQYLFILLKYLEWC